MIEESEKICGKTKCTSKSKRTRWWDNAVKQAVTEKRRQYLLWKEEKNQEEKLSRVKKGKGQSDKEIAYHKANKESKRVIQKAKDRHRQTFVEELEREDRKGNTFKVVQQELKRNRDVVGVACIKDKNGKVVVEEDAIKVV